MYCLAVMVGLEVPCAAIESFLISAGLTHATTRAFAPKSMVVPREFAAFADDFAYLYDVIFGVVAFVKPSAMPADFVMAAQEGAAALALREKEAETVIRPATRIADVDKIEVRRMGVLSWVSPR